MDLLLILSLILVSLPGILLTIPSIIRSLLAIMPSAGAPPKHVIVAVSIIQSLFLVTIASVVGALLAPSVGLSAPVFEGLVDGSTLDAFINQLVPTLLYSVTGALVFVVVYYTVFRPHIDKKSLRTMEGLRRDLGLRGRLLYGGIVEEVLCRWGLMTFIAWVGLQLSGAAGAGVMWAAIIISGILFGIGHLPSYIGMGCEKSFSVVSFMITLNLWAALIFGWLFWQYGLVSAMIAHMVFHLVWYPFDERIRG